MLFVVSFLILSVHLGSARKEFKKVEMPIAFCAAENMFMLDRWTIKRECPNEDYLFPAGVQSQNCKKDNWNSFMQGSTDDLTEKANKKDLFGSIRDEKLKEFAQKRHSQITKDGNMDDMMKRSKISDEEYDKIKQKNDELFKQYQQQQQYRETKKTDL